MGLLNVPWWKTSSTKIKDCVLRRSCRILSTEAVLPQHSVRQGSLKVLHPWLQENTPCHSDWRGPLMFSGQDSLGKRCFMPVGLRLCRFSLTSRRKSDLPSVTHGSTSSQSSHFFLLLPWTPTTMMNEPKLHSIRAKVRRCRNNGNWPQQHSADPRHSSRQFSLISINSFPIHHTPQET